ncbi:MAG: peptidoglycan/xylan/chitin deacetylase (PgdA/CDA1 family), partial [Myxococcota bacterium]
MGARWDRPVETRRLAVNVDVDSLSLYHDIHGLDPDGASDACWEVGVPRFLELFEAHDLRATFFCVASDLSRPGPRRVAQEAVARGHELASHTLTHPYDLIHQDDAAIEAEIAGAETALAELRGAPVAGFRAPGYNLSPTVLKVLERRGYRYDSSRFPCPAYFLLRAGIISGMRVVGRTSKSIVGDLKAPFGPRHPHRMV